MGRPVYDLKKTVGRRNTWAVVKTKSRGELSCAAGGGCRTRGEIVELRERGREKKKRGKSVSFSIGLFNMRKYETKRQGREASRLHRLLYSKKKKRKCSYIPLKERNRKAKSVGGDVGWVECWRRGGDANHLPLSEA